MRIKCQPEFDMPIKLLDIFISLYIPSAQAYTCMHGDGGDEDDSLACMPRVINLG